MLQQTTTRSIWDLGLQIFRKNMELSPQVEKKIGEAILDQIRREREGENINRSMMKCLVRMLTSLNLYSGSNRFEKLFLTSTGDYYATESQNQLKTANVSEYMIHVEKRLNEEIERTESYLDSATNKTLINTVENNMIKVHVNIMLEKNFDQLMNEDRRPDLKRMYSLFARVNSLDSMRHSFLLYAKRKGAEIVQDEERDKDMVQTLLELKQRLDSLVADAMAGNEDFDRALRDSFEDFINSRENRPAELIAKYIDAQLRTGNKGGSEMEIEDVLDQVMVLFRFINGKDVFEAFYKKDLAKRLLLGKSASYDLEKVMIAKLKSECGSQFTNKLEGMFKDIDLSKDLMSSFLLHQQKSESSSSASVGVEMNVFILTTVSWPAYTQTVDPNVFSLPPQLLSKQKEFEKFYYSKYAARRLKWQPSLCHCLVRADLLSAGKKEFQVSLFQAMVLLLFDQESGEKISLSYDEIKGKTGVEAEELRRTLQSLACGKVRILQKNPKGRDVANSDRFVVNPEFKSKAYRIKINSIQMKESAKENKETHAKIFQDRQYQIDAAIVRIMKARKTLSHNLLVSELFKQLKFPAKPQDLKKRIESLLDREYLERDDQDATLYKYLA